VRFVLLLAVTGCVVRSGYSYRNASGASVSTGIEGAKERAAFGAQFGVAAHDEAQGTAFSVRSDLHVGISSIRDILEMRTVEWSASVFAGINWTAGDGYKDITVPVGPGLTFVRRIGDDYAVSVQPRYNVHLGDESPMGSRHEILISVGFHWVPAIDYMTKL
jgi:hypothetical protein